MVLIPFVVLGEMYFGAVRSGRVAINIARVSSYAASNVVLFADEETTLRYGEIKQQLKVKGRPIPENDIWIAAVALRHGLPVLTRDAHFNEVVGLTVVSW